MCLNKNDILEQSCSPITSHSIFFPSYPNHCFTSNYPWCNREHISRSYSLILIVKRNIYFRRRNIFVTPPIYSATSHWDEVWLFAITKIYVCFKEVQISQVGNKQSTCMLHCLVAPICLVIVGTDGGRFTNFKFPHVIGGW